jgi:hypothetical protein
MTRSLFKTVALLLVLLMTHGLAIPMNYTRILVEFLKMNKKQAATGRIDIIFWKEFLISQRTTYSTLYICTCLNGILLEAVSETPSPILISALASVVIELVSGNFIRLLNRPLYLSLQKWQRDIWRPTGIWSSV